MSLGGSHLAEFRVPVDERSTEGAGLNRSVRSGTTGDGLVWGRYDLVFLNAVMRPLIRLWLEFSVSSWGGGHHSSEVARRSRRRHRPRTSAADR